MSLFDALPADACPAFRILRTAESSQAQAARDHCLDLWRDFAPHADAHFLTEFPRQLHQRWFEMYLFVALLRAGYQVTAPKPGPDVLLTLDGRRIWIEAICATPGAEGRADTVPEPRIARIDKESIVSAVPVNAMSLRVAAAVAEKQRKFSGYIENGAVPTGDVTVIAVNVHAVHFAGLDMEDRMLGALYGQGYLVVSIDRATGKAVDVQRQQRPALPKASGAEVPAQPFSDGSMPHVSAVIGSRVDAGNLPRARLGDDFALYPNLTASVPWPAGAVKLGKEWIAKAQPDGSHDMTRMSYTP